MNDTTALPPVAPAEPRHRSRRFWKILVYFSLLLNILFCLWFRAFITNEEEDLPERRLYGDKKADDKIAVIRIEGVLMEGMTRYYLKQIQQAAKDEHVKAIVVRIDSPGGTVSASEEIHRLLLQLRDGKVRAYPDSKPKKIIVSMGAIAASGGYYIAMPAERIFAERVCITGSIGVYASLPNVAEFVGRHGVKFELIKAGDIKAGGSPFHELTPQERQPWQDMVDSAYDHFLEVVEAGRPNLNKAALRDEIVFRDRIAIRDGKGNVVLDWFGDPTKVDYVRRRADGGSFTAAEALKFGLIDEIGGMDAAVDAAAKSAGLKRFQVVAYDRPPSLLMDWLGVKTNINVGLDPGRIANAATPRVWYLAPQADLAGILSAMGRD
jgi:protease IV